MELTYVLPLADRIPGAVSVSSVSPPPPPPPPRLLLLLPPGAAWIRFRGHRQGIDGIAYSNKGYLLGIIFSYFFISCDIITTV